MNKNITTRFLGILAIIIVIFGGFWYFYVKNPTTIKYSATNTPTSVLERQNKNYAEAISYEKAKSYDLALLSYQKALPEAQDQTQTVQIQLKI
ncbi:MAG: hypothetical protein WA057_05315, partial [Candidatus Magasanikiibacteriota bacterium]